MCWAGRMEQEGHLSNHLFYLHNFLECQKCKEGNPTNNAFSLLQ